MARSHEGSAACILSSPLPFTTGKFQLAPFLESPPHTRVHKAPGARPHTPLYSHNHNQLIGPPNTRSASAEHSVPPANEGPTSPPYTNHTMPSASLLSPDWLGIQVVTVPMIQAPTLPDSHPWEDRQNHNSQPTSFPTQTLPVKVLLKQPTRKWLFQVAFLLSARKKARWPPNCVGDGAAANGPRQLQPASSSPACTTAKSLAST